MRCFSLQNPRFRLLAVQDLIFCQEPNLVDVAISSHILPSQPRVKAWITGMALAQVEISHLKDDIG